MESSSESFLWSDASNDSSDNRKFGSVQAMGDSCRDESSTGVNCEDEARDTIVKDNHDSNENEMPKRPKKSKKRKYSETTQEGSDFSHPGRKKIKLEPESDIDAKKKKKPDKINNTCNNEPHDSVMYHEDYLELRVKQEQLSALSPEVDTPKKKKKKRRSLTDIDKNAELSSLEFNNSHSENYLNIHVKEEQTSLVKPKKKKQKQSNINTDNGGESDSAVRESNLEAQVKQEQASLVDAGMGKLKKIKKHKSSVITPEVDTSYGTKSVIKFDDSPDINNSTGRGDETEYSVVEEKFSAEETVVEKPRKKKRKREAVAEINGDCDDTSAMTAEEHSEHMNENDISLQPSDFTCSNIASSTVINNSAVDVTNSRQELKSENLVGGRKKEYPKKISDRIRFEDDSSTQESVASTLSTKINRFLKANPHLELYNPESQEQSFITKDDEIWALKWPHEIDLEKLKNTTLVLEGKYKIKMEGYTYEGVPSENLNRIALVVHQGGRASLTSLPVNECIHYHKRIPKPHLPDCNVMVNNQTNFMPLPETKCRHPLFGPHYRKSIKIPSAIAEHLDAAKQRSRETTYETTKKKKRKQNKHGELGIKMESDCKPEPLKKKKKRRHSGDDDTYHKPKRIKLESNSPAVWESEQAIEENLFNF